MREVKVIAALAGADKKRLAMQLSGAGADAIYYVMESLADTDMLKELSAAVDIPLVVRMSPKTMADVELVIENGASQLLLETEDNALIKTALEAYGADKIGVVVNTYYVPDELAAAGDYSRMGVGAIYITDHKATGENIDMLVSLRHSVGNPLIINAGDVHDDFMFLANYVAATKIDWCIVSLSDVSQLNALKSAFSEKGIKATAFKSKIPFSEFKLNEDGLIPVVVQEDKTLEVLMLAYMNEASYNMTIQTGRMTYFSRSRQSLWVKGETSGHFQYVKSMEIDCDKDTILARVTQIGAACHTGNPTCFFTDLL